jgi:hypothetical protein
MSRTLSWAGDGNSLFDVLDYKIDNKAKVNLRKRYKFLDGKRTKYLFDGLSKDALEWFMA